MALSSQGRHGGEAQLRAGKTSMLAGLFARRSKRFPPFKIRVEVLLKSLAALFGDDESRDSHIQHIDDR